MPPTSLVIGAEFFRWTILTIVKQQLDRYNASETWCSLHGCPAQLSRGERFKAMKRISIAVVLVLIVSLTLVFQSSLRVSARVTGNDVTSSGTPYSAEWRLTGPTGGDVRGLVADPNDPDRFYFGTLDGQIYTSTD